MTKLDELVSAIKSKHVYIQTHNFPDPDAIASAFGLQYLLRGRGIDSTICYKGKIDRTSLKRMIEYLNIEIFNLEDLGFIAEEEEVVLVDAQKGNANIIDMPGDEIACIDHHPTYEPIEYRFKDVRPQIGACASIIAEYFYENNIEIDKVMATTLMYGIKIDTANMTRGVSQLDLDVFYKLYSIADKDILKKLDSCNIQLEDLKAYASAINSIQVFDNIGFANTGYDCPEPLVANISDFMLALEVVEFSVIYSIKRDGIKLSVRSSRSELNAGRITSEALKGLGGGGGHASMAGGFVPFGEYENKKELLIDQIREKYMTVITAITQKTEN